MLAQYIVRVAPRGIESAATTSDVRTAPMAWALFCLWVALCKCMARAVGDVHAAPVVELCLVLPAGNRVIYATDTQGEPQLLTARLDDLYAAVVAAGMKTAEFDALLTALTAEED